MERLSIRRLAAGAAGLALILAGCTGTGAGTAASPSAAATQAPSAGDSAAPSASSDASGAPSQAATGDIRYLVEAPENAEDLQPLRDHIKNDFEANHPGITVTLDSLPLETMRTVLQTQLRSATGPDVFAWGSGPSYAGALAKAGLLYDLTDAYQRYNWPIYDFAKKQVTYDGKVVGIPGEVETVGLYYNKQIFSDLGLNPPQTLADLDAAAAKIKESGKIPFALGDKEGWEGGHWLSMALSSRIGSQGINDLIAGKTSWDSPDVVAALKIWSDWNAAGYFPPTPTSIDYDSGNALYFSGDAAMLPTGSWLINDIAANTDFETGYVPFPAPDGAGIFTGGLGSGPYISANTAHPEAALEFVNFLVSPEHGRWTVENLQTIPTYPVDTAGLNVNPLMAQVIADTAKLSGGNGDFGSNIDVQSTDTFNDAMFNGIQALLTGQKTPEEVAKDLQAAKQKG